VRGDHALPQGLQEVRDL